RDGDVVEVAGGDAGGPEAVADRLLGEAGPVLDAVEPLLLDGGDEPAVDHQRGRRVAVEGVDAKDDHVRRPGGAGAACVCRGRVRASPPLPDPGVPAARQVSEGLTVSRGGRMCTGDARLMKPL